MNSPIHVLLVEDNPTDVILIQEALSMAEHEVLHLAVAERLSEATALLGARPFDVVLLDLQLPDSSGLETFERIRRIAEDVAVIVLTGMSDHEIGVHAIRQGAEEFIVKGKLDTTSLTCAIRYAFERRRLRRELCERERQLARAQEIAQLGSWEWDLATDQVSCSDELARIFGISRERMPAALLARIRYIVTHRDSGGLVHSAAEEPGRPIAFEQSITTPDGNTRILFTHCRAIYEGTGLPVRVIGTCQDITERKAIEEQLQKQAELLDLAPDAIMVRSLDGRLEFWNKGAERMFGWSGSEAVGRNVTDLVYPDHRQFADVQHKLLCHGEWSGELTLCTKDKVPVIVSSRWTLVRDAHGQPESVLVIDSDITEKKQLQAQFLRAQRLESLGTLASGVAHDLNNILAPILMSVPLLRESLEPETKEAILSTIELSAERGSEIVKQVLTFARGVEGDKVLLAPNRLVKEMRKVAEQTFPKSIRIKFEHSGDTWLVEGDPTQLHQVLMNLCVNARDAMPDGGDLSLHAENFIVDDHYASMTPGAKPGRYVVFKLTDSGTGIPREIVDKIFDPFFTTKEAGKGTGLGLSTVLGITQSHQGFVTVRSESGRGTTFCVFLPAAGEQLENARTDPATELPAGRGETILVVDDEDSILTVTETVLRKYNYEVLTANDSVGAVALFAQNIERIDLVITDVLMPLMDGVSLIRVLKRMRPDVRFIASTGHAEERHLADLNELQVPACLKKPYDTGKLLQTIREVIE